MARPTRSAATSSACTTPVRFIAFLACDTLCAFRVSVNTALCCQSSSFSLAFRLYLTDRQAHQRHRVRLVRQARPTLLLHHWCRPSHQGMGRRRHQDEPWREGVFINGGALVKTLIIAATVGSRQPPTHSSIILTLKLSDSLHVFTLSCRLC